MKDVREEHKGPVCQPVIFSWLSWLSKVVLLVKKPGGESGTLAFHTRDQGLLVSALHTII